MKLPGLWLQQDGSWGKHVIETRKKAYMRMSFISKLRYAGVSRTDLILNYKQFIRTVLEYCSVAFHSSLTVAQSDSLERCQAVALRIILQDNYESYESALLLTGLEKLSLRRTARCLDFSLKCIDHHQNKRFFPKNPNLGNGSDVRDREEFTVNFARTKQYRESAIPYCQRLLNQHVRDKRATAREQVQEGAGAGPGARSGVEQEEEGGQEQD